MYNIDILIPDDINMIEEFIGVVEDIEVYAPIDDFRETLYAPFELYDLNDYIGGE